MATPKASSSTASTTTTFVQPDVPPISITAEDLICLRRAITSCHCPGNVTKIQNEKTLTQIATSLQYTWVGSNENGSYKKMATTRKRKATTHKPTIAEQERKRRKTLRGEDLEKFLDSTISDICFEIAPAHASQTLTEAYNRFKDSVYPTYYKNDRLNQNEYSCEIHILYMHWKREKKGTNEQFIKYFTEIDSTFSKSKFYKIKRIGKLIIAFPRLAHVSLSTHDFLDIIGNIEKLFFIDNAKNNAFEEKWTSIPDMSIPASDCQSDVTISSETISQMKKCKIESRDEYMDDDYL